MVYENSHLTDQDLLLAADGELPARRQSAVRAHLTSCWTCRTRMSELEASIADFVHFYYDDLDSRIPSRDGPSALLKATLAQRIGSTGSRSWTEFLPLPPRRDWIAATLTVALCCAAILVGIFVHKAPRGESMLRAAQTLAGAEPDAYLTPGATRPVSRAELCGTGESGRIPEAPGALQDAVFREYGIARPQVRAYEVDYLITPELGGANDIRNLWPEPYSTTAWNAHVKDVLENRLREMVCRGDLDLETAQHDLSVDWIAAYKKYFQTDRPLISDLRSR